jgi:hypothetical protein
MLLTNATRISMHVSRSWNKSFFAQQHNFCKMCDVNKTSADRITLCREFSRGIQNTFINTPIQSYKRLSFLWLYFLLFYLSFLLALVCAISHVFGAEMRVRHKAMSMSFGTKMRVPDKVVNLLCRVRVATPAASKGPLGLIRYSNLLHLFLSHAFEGLGQLHGTNYVLQTSFVLSRAVAYTQQRLEASLQDLKHLRVDVLVCVSRHAALLAVSNQNLHSQVLYQLCFDGTQPGCAMSRIISVSAPLMVFVS